MAYKLFNYLTHGEVYHMREYSDFIAVVTPLTFGRARINIGPKNTEMYDDGW
jgi:hypothetical protein